MENWDDLKYLLAVFRYKTMTRAAREMNTTVATVSRRIDRLSEELDGPPIVKVGGEWTLSEHVLPLLEIAETFDSGLRAYSNKDVRKDQNTDVHILIGCPPVISSQVLFPFLGSSAAPPENISMSLVDRNEQSGIGDCDLVIRMGSPGNGRIITRKVGELDFQLVRHVNWNEPLDWVGLIEDHYDFPSVEISEKYFSGSPKLQVETFEHILQCIKQGALAGGLPVTMIENEPELVPLPSTKTSAEFWVSYHVSRKNDPAIKSVVKWITHCFKCLK